MKKTLVNEHRGQIHPRIRLRGNEPEVLVNPVLRIALRDDSKNQRDEPDNRVEADEHEGDDGIPFGPVIHARWNRDEHGAVRRAKSKSSVPASQAPAFRSAAFMPLQAELQ